MRGGDQSTIIAFSRKTRSMSSSESTSSAKYSDICGMLSIHVCWQFIVGLPVTSRSRFGQQFKGNRFAGAGSVRFFWQSRRTRPKKMSNLRWRSFGRVITIFITTDKNKNLIKKHFVTFLSPLKTHNINLCQSDGPAASRNLRRVGGSIGRRYPAQQAGFSHP